MVGQALTGKRNSIPKITNMKADDNKKVVYKNMGNNHAYPIMWCDTITVSGSEAVVASGVEFHGLELATYGNVVATPKGSITGTYYIEMDTTNNIVKIKSSATINADFFVQLTLGDNSPPRFIENFVCRGNRGAVKNF